MNLQPHLVHSPDQPAISLMARLRSAVTDDYSTLVLDRQGRVRSCGESAEHMFRTRQSRLVGRLAADLIPSLFPKTNSRSDRAKHLALEAKDGAWHHHQIIDAEGCEFDVELCVSCIATDGQEIFLVNVHRVGEAIWC